LFQRILEPGEQPKWTPNSLFGLED
jgi:hypothetical protein